MSCKISKSTLAGTIICPANKSYTHRAVFVASLSNKKSMIKNVLYSADTSATILACKEFGADIIQDGSTLEIKGVQSPKAIDVNAQNSGTTIRIAAAIASLSQEKSRLAGDSSLEKRPMQPLLDALESLGAKCTSNDGRPPITIQGKITGGDANISGNVSSQFISAILIAAPLTEKGITLDIDGKLVSRPYLDATIATMKSFGVRVNSIQPYKKYHIAHQDYTSTNFTVPSDYSSLALLLCASVLVGKDMCVKADSHELPQGDAKFLDMLETLGVTVKKSEDAIKTVVPDKLKGGRFDLGDTPDLLPPLAILGIMQGEPIEIYNAGHARLKETDRIKILCRELAKTGLHITESEDGMRIENHGNLHGVDFDSQNDHRLFMAFCIAGMYLGDSTVSNPESVTVSYPEFVVQMQKIGASIYCT